MLQIMCKKYPLYDNLSLKMSPVCLLWPMYTLLHDLIVGCTNNWTPPWGHAPDKSTQSRPESIQRPRVEQVNKRQTQLFRRHSILEPSKYPNPNHFTPRPLSGGKKKHRIYIKPYSKRNTHHFWRSSGKFFCCEKSFEISWTKHNIAIKQ